MAKSHTHTELVGKVVYYRKQNYAWELGKVKSVVLYMRGPKKGQLNYARISTLKAAYNRDGTPKWKKASCHCRPTKFQPDKCKDITKCPCPLAGRIYRWTGPCRRTDTIYEVLRGKNTWIPIDRWLA